MKHKRTVPQETLGSLVAAIDTEWSVASAAPVNRGHHIVSHLTVEVGDGWSRGECVLKATPHEQPAMCSIEARILAIRANHTSLPVPQVLRVVDKCQELPTRFFAAKALSGANGDRTDLPGFTRPAVRAFSASIGRHLAALHDLDAVNGFGTVTVDRRERLHGDPPAAPSEIPTVQISTAAWGNFRRSDVDRMLFELDDTLFSDLSTGIRASLAEKLGDLTDDHGTVVARIDQSLHNAIIDPETGRVPGLLDWEFYLATTPVSELAFLGHSLADGLWEHLQVIGIARQQSDGRCWLAIANDGPGRSSRPSGKTGSGTAS